MDKVIKGKKKSLKKVYRIAALIVGVVAVYLSLKGFSDNRYSLDASSITIGTVKKNIFQEWISETGIVQPMNSVFLDAIERGIIKKKLVESGTTVTKGDTLLILTNSELELDVLNRQSQLYEQMNNLRTSKLLLMQNMRTLKNSLNEIQYNIKLSAPAYERGQRLVEKGVISRQEFEQLEETHLFNLQQKETETRFYESELSRQRFQLDQLQKTSEQIGLSLEAVSKILDNLIVRAPIDGLYSSQDLQVGQSINQNERIGQIDVTDNFKLRTEVDEVYISRLEIGQKVSIENFDLKDSAQLEISKIYPTISDGTFDVDLRFLDSIPKSIKRGQSIRIRLVIGEEKESLVIPFGPFYQTTGGNWIYLIDNTKKEATKREIKLGRRNSNEIEVLSGLDLNDEVIVSNYNDFKDKKIISINY